MFCGSPSFVCHERTTQLSGVGGAFVPAPMAFPDMSNTPPPSRHSPPALQFLRFGLNPRPTIFQTQTSWASPQRALRTTAQTLTKPSRPATSHLCPAARRLPETLGSRPDDATASFAIATQNVLSPRSEWVTPFGQKLYADELCVLVTQLTSLERRFDERQPGYP